MLERTKALARRALRELATIPIWSLGEVERSKVIEHLFDSMTARIEVENHKLLFMASTPVLQWRARTALSKEPDTIRWIEQFQPNDILWDIGANVGVYSIYAAVLRGVHVLAFEPSADNYMVLCKNVQINTLCKRVVPYCIAFNGSTELGLLNSNSRVLGAALHQFGRAGDSSRYWTNKIGSCIQGMVGFSIDDFIRQFSPAFPTHLKLDVDGLEIDILRGASKTLRDGRVRSIMVELSIDDDEGRGRGLQFLSDAGFELVSQGDVQKSAGAEAANHFFAKK